MFPQKMIKIIKKGEAINYKEHKKNNHYGAKGDQSGDC